MDYKEIIIFYFKYIIHILLEVKLNLGQLEADLRISKQKTK